MADVVGITLAVVGVAAFGYFLYTKWQASKNKASGSGSDGGGRPGTKLN